ncbi:MAG: putative ABC transport system permease protein, partial [Cyclobacteriaceae bacterium]
MFKNLIVSAIRNLKKKPAFTFINILGLSLGMATCLLITLYVQYDLSFDDYQDNNVYRVALKRIYPEREVEYAFTPHSISPQMVLDFPEVVDQARLFKVSGSVILEHEEDQFAEENVVFADSSIFRLIKIDFINGNQATALTDPSAIVLTERIAKKIFGSTDIIGETLQTPNGPLQISAIVENYPENSHF